MTSITVYEVLMKLKKLFGVLLLAGCLALTGCGGDAPETTADTAAETEIVQVPDLCLFENGEGLYKFVRPDECSDDVTAAATLGWKLIKDQYGPELKITTDWVKKSAVIPVDTPEILIGMTNRPESAEIAGTVGANEYRVVCAGNRIVIAAAKDWMLQPAMEALAAAITVDENGRGTVPGDLDLVYDYSGGARPGWLLNGVPSYDDGVLSETFAKETLGFMKKNAASKVMCVSKTNGEQFADYIEKVKSEGYTVLQRADWDGLTAYQCDKDDVSFYAYYADGTKEARIILEKSDTVSLEEFNYTAEPADGASNDVYLFGVMMDPDGIDFAYNGNTRLNCGQMLFMKLADNSLVIIDGGGVQQMSDSAAEEFLRLAREATGVPEGEKMRISCWFITHRHGDHFQGFNRFITKYHDQFEMERILYNIIETDDAFTRVTTTVSRYYPDILYHKPHTGETVQLADISMDVMYTQEDLMDPRTMKYKSSDFNDRCTVLKVHFDGKSFMILGDIYGSAETTLLSYYSGDMLKSDVVQVSHHGWNYMPSLYAAIDAKIALYPQSSGGAERGLSGGAERVVKDVRKNCDELYFAGDETVGVRVIDGDVEVFCRYPVVGSDYSGWNWY